MITYQSVTVDERCEPIIQACLNRISMVTAHYGADVGNEMAASFAYSFGRLHAFGGTIYPDGPMGLICAGTNITVGMVFFEDSDERTLRKINRHGMLGQLDADWPRTGEWSLHS